MAAAPRTRATSAKPNTSNRRSPTACGAGEAGTGKEEFFGSPSTVFVDPEGHLWVGDKERVLEFDSEGAFIAEAAVPGSRRRVVSSIGFDETSEAAKSGHLYLKSGLLSGVREYEVTGAPPTLTLTQVGELDGEGSASALVVDSAGNVYVGDCAKAEATGPSALPTASCATTTRAH